MNQLVKTRLLIVDDHELFAKGLQYIIERVADGIAVVGIASNGEQALAIVDGEPVDVVLLDVRMPVMDGVEATKLLRRFHPQLRIIMLTTFDDDEYVQQAIRHGAAGYLLKSIRPDALVNAIQTVMSGQMLFDGKLRSLGGLGKAGQTEVDAIISQLTRRERQVLELVLEAKSNRQIREQLGLSDHSVRNYVSTVYMAFGVKDRFDLIQKLRQDPGSGDPV